MGLGGTWRWQQDKRCPAVSGLWGGSQWLSAVLFDDGGWLEQLHLSFCSLTWPLCLSHFSRTPQGPPGFPALMQGVRSGSPGTWPLGALRVPWVLTSTQGLRTTSLLLGFQQPVLLMAQEPGLVWSSQSWATTAGSQQGLHSWGQREPGGREDLLVTRVYVVTHSGTGAKIVLCCQR